MGGRGRVEEGGGGGGLAYMNILSWIYELCFDQLDNYDTSHKAQPAYKTKDTD